MRSGMVDAPYAPLACGRTYDHAEAAARSGSRLGTLGWTS